MFRGSYAGAWLAFGTVALLGAVGCGGSGGDDAAGSAAAASHASSGAGSGATGGTENAAGATDTGGTGGGTGGTASGSGGSSGYGGSGGSATGGSSSSGTGGSGGSAKGGGSGTGSSTGGGATLDDIGDACKADCDAQFALDCAPTTTNTLTCQLSCAAQTTQLGDFCLTEYHDYVQCRADGGYDCVSSNPYPRATCAKEQLAFTQCAQHIGCKRYCEKVGELGCSDAAFDACVDSCTQGDTTLDTTCAYSYESIAYCQATQGAAVCQGDGLSVPAVCTSAVMNVAECIDRNASDMCVGYCWAADHLGCGGDDCAGDCAAKTADTACGGRWNDLLDCVLFFGDAECTADGLTGNGICDSEMSAYQSCVDGSSTQ